MDVTEYSILHEDIVLIIWVALAAIRSFLIRERCGGPGHRGEDGGKVGHGSHKLNEIAPAATRCSKAFSILPAPK